MEMNPKIAAQQTNLMLGGEVWEPSSTNKSTYVWHDAGAACAAAKEQGGYLDTASRAHSLRLTRDVSHAIWSCFRLLSVSLPSADALRSTYYKAHFELGADATEYTSAAAEAYAKRPAKPAHRSAHDRAVRTEANFYLGLEKAEMKSMASSDFDHKHVDVRQTRATAAALKKGACWCCYATQSLLQSCTHDHSECVCGQRWNRAQISVPRTLSLELTRPPRSPVPLLPSVRRNQAIQSDWERNVVRSFAVWTNGFVGCGELGVWTIAHRPRVASVTLQKSRSTPRCFEPRISTPRHTRSTQRRQENSPTPETMKVSTPGRCCTAAVLLCCWCPRQTRPGHHHCCCCTGHGRNRDERDRLKGVLRKTNFSLGASELDYRTEAMMMQGQQKKVLHQPFKVTVRSRKK